MNTLVIARHGDYDTTRANGGLNEVGRLKVRQLAEELKSRVAGGSVWILCSDTERAKESAYILSDVLEAPAEVCTVLLSDGNKDVDLPAILGLVRAKKHLADMLILVTHLEVTRDFPAYFAKNEMSGTAFPGHWGLIKGTASVIDCESRTITRVNDH